MRTLTLTTALARALTLTAVALLASGAAFRADQDDPASAPVSARVLAEVSSETPAMEDETGAPQAAPSTAESNKTLSDQERSLREQRDALREEVQALKEQGRALREQEKVIRIVGSDRPRIGIILETEADPESDPIGARIQAITPGGPADQAGLKSDDIIVKFKGQILTGPNPDADPDESGPATKLLALTKGLKDGEKVVIEYRRGKETKTATIVPRVMKEKNMRVIVNVPDLHELKDLKIPELANLPENFDFTFDLPGDVLDMELVELNPDLGDYFGTSQGLLVVSAPADSPLKLKGGDVILKIGDRKPTTPSQALRILRSYEPKETVTIEVLRKRQHLTLSSTLPERKESRPFNWHPKSPSAPTPPAAPAPPTPP
ncbi:MAG: hypothetical protein B7X11_01965, partial [Acidobacteria bacterium 37-65-4]